MFELVFLLLPIAAAYGYYMGRSSLKNKQAASQTESTQNYLKGVDYMLNNDKEQAMDKFIAYLNATDPTVESTLALGNLFRKRGEVDKAISLHSSLATNDEIEPYESELARIELAYDFISAGLLDRAESILLELIEIPRQRKSAAVLLVKVYEQERDFNKAIEVGLNHKDVLGKSSLNRLANYYCELSQQSLIAGKFKEAEAKLNSALGLNPNSIRPRLMKCEIYLKSQKPNASEEIVKLINEVTRLDPSTGIMCLELLKKCFINKADPLYRIALEDLVRKTKSAAAMVELCLVVDSTGSHEDAELMLLNFLKEKPNLKLFSSFMNLRSKDNPNVETTDVIMQLKSLIDAQIASNAHYSCSKCGFESTMMFWQCPSCRRWDTMRAKRGLDGD